MKHENITKLRGRIETLFSKQGMSPFSFFYYRSTWNYLERFMQNRGTTDYTCEIGKFFLKEFFGDVLYTSLTEYQKKRYKHILTLDEVLEGKPISIRTRKSSKHYSFEGKVGQLVVEYIENLSLKMNYRSQQRYIAPLGLFNEFLLNESRTLETIDVPLVIRYLTKLNTECTPSDAYQKTCILRRFILYLCSLQKLSDNRETIWSTVLKTHEPKARRLPAIYSDEEVEQLISSIDRSSPLGKRNYAMILLAARYGMRASDIIGLRFSNIDWVHNSVNIVQTKTKKPLSFPLSEEVGCAIIDYIRNGRCLSDLPFVFLRVIHPPMPLATSAFFPYCIKTVRKSQNRYD